MYATHRQSRPFLVRFGLPLAVIAVLLVGAVAFYYLSPPLFQTPLDVPRSAAARQYLEKNLATRWAKVPWALEALDTVEVRGPVLYIKTTAPSTGDVREQVVPTCFVAMDYVESGVGLKSFRIAAADGTTFKFTPNMFCLMDGY